ncbi:uncharacterized protein LOC143040759 [Oratosquilla oratoria]|uniref:uncharacterized protein LOC143040759 n=1 Tax=Oratosquilla oratoria TaxID=337810 RepID=UPI003F7617B1
MCLRSKLFVELVTTTLLFMLVFAKADEKDGVIEQLAYEFEHILEDYLVEWKLLTEPASSLFKEKRPNVSIDDLGFNDAKDILIGTRVILDSSEFDPQNGRDKYDSIPQFGDRNSLFRNFDNNDAIAKEIANSKNPSRKSEDNSRKIAEEDTNPKLQIGEETTNIESVYVNASEHPADEHSVQRQLDGGFKCANVEQCNGEPLDKFGHSDSSNGNTGGPGNIRHLNNDNPDDVWEDTPRRQHNPDELRKNPRGFPRTFREVIPGTKIHERPQKPGPDARPDKYVDSGGRSQNRQQRDINPRVPVIYMPGQKKKTRKCVNVHGIFNSHNAYNYLSFVTGIISLILNINNNINNNNNNNNINDNNAASNNNVDANSNTQSGNQIVVFPGRRRRRRRTFLDVLLDSSDSSDGKTHQENKDQEGGSSFVRKKETQNSSDLKYKKELQNQKISPDPKFKKELQNSKMSPDFKYKNKVQNPKESTDVRFENKLQNTKESPDLKSKNKLQNPKNSTNVKSKNTSRSEIQKRRTHQENKDQKANLKDGSSFGMRKETQNSPDHKPKKKIPPILKDLLPALFTASVPYVQILAKGNPGSPLEKELRLDDFEKTWRRTWRPQSQLGSREPGVPLVEFYIRTALRAILSESP